MAVVEVGSLGGGLVPFVVGGGILAMGVCVFRSGFGRSGFRDSVGGIDVEGGGLVVGF